MATQESEYTITLPGESASSRRHQSNGTYSFMKPLRPQNSTTGSVFSFIWIISNGPVSFPQDMGSGIVLQYITVFMIWSLRMVLRVSRRIFTEKRYGMTSWT